MKEITATNDDIPVPSPNVPAVALSTPDGRAATHICCQNCRHEFEAAPVPAAQEVCPACGNIIRSSDNRLTSTTDELRVLGRFQLLQEVGAGGFGTVWRARDVELGRQVALKIPHAGKLESVTGRERFQREARAAAQLRHPNIVTVHEVALLDGRPTIVADFVEGVTLNELQHVRRLTCRESVDIVTQLAEALDYAHTMGMVHRDVKPSNIMIERRPSGWNPMPDDDGSSSGSSDATERTSPAVPPLRPLLMDFGLALRDEIETTITVDGQVIGTPAYMSPEQAAGRSHQVDRRSDVYSLGVVLYESLTGELPFRGPRNVILHKVMHEEPRPLRRVDQRIPRDLETICLKAMAKAPKQRFRTARALAEDLRRWLRGEPVTARPVGPIERWWRWCRRNPLVASLTAAVAVLLLGTTIAAILVAFRLDAARQKADSARNDEADARRQIGSLAETLYHKVYSSRMNLAFREWEKGNTVRVLELLNNGRPEPGKDDLRGFEWYHVWWRCHRDLHTLRGHDGQHLCAAFSPDGKYLVTGGRDHTIRLWDPRQGRQMDVLRGHTDAVVCLDFSRDGAVLATGSADKTVRLWDLATRQELTVLKGNNTQGVLAVAFSRNGEDLAVSCGRDERLHPVTGQIQLWHVATRKVRARLKGHTGPTTALVFSRDGKILVSGSMDETARLWDVATGTEVACLRGHVGGIDSVALSPDGKTLACGGGYSTSPSEVKLWELDSRKLQAALKHPQQVTALAFAPDSKTLAVGDIDIALWDLESQRIRETIRGHTYYIGRLAYSPDGRMLVSAGRDATTRIWDPSRHLGPIRLGGFSEPPSAMAFSSDGRKLAVGTRAMDGSVKVWEADSWTSSWLLPKRKGWVNGLAFTRDGRLITGSGEVDVEIWDPETAGPRSTLSPTKPCSAVALSPDGKMVATAGRGTIKVWDLAAKQILYSLEAPEPQLPGHGFVSLAFSRDGRFLAAGGTDNLVHLWDAANGTLVTRLRGHAGVVLSLAFSLDGKTLASGGWVRFEQPLTEPAELKLWDLETFQERLTIRAHNQAVSSLAYSPDGRTLVSGGGRGTVKFWDPATGEERGSLEMPQNGWVLCLTFSPDGTKLATGSGAANQPGEVLIWEAATETDVARRDR